MAIENIGTDLIMTVNEQDFSKDLGQRIARFRKEQGLTQQQVAEALGLKQYAVANYETARYRVPVALIPELARILGATVDNLMGTSPARSKPGPAPKVQKQLERIQTLPKDRQRFVMQALDMALRSA